MGPLRTNAPRSGAAEHDAATFFLSYAHADQQAALRIRDFLHTFRFPRDESGRRRRLRGFRDVEDLRAGKLEDELRSALAAADALVVCCSPNARESKWVSRELRWFDEDENDRTVCAALLDGDERSARPSGMEKSGLYFADLRQGWRFGRPRAKTRLELIRIIAAISGLDLRELVDLDRRRRLKRRFFTVAAFAGLLVGIASLPITRWDAVPLPETVQYPVDAAEVIDGRLAVATRLRTNDGERSRNYVQLHQAGVEAWWIDDNERAYVPRRRMFPIEALQPDIVRYILEALKIDVERDSALWLARPGAEIFVGLRRPDDETATALSHEHFAGVSDVYVARGTSTRLSSSAIELYPDSPMLEGPRSMSPADGLSIASLSSGLWLGAERRSDGRGNGGLWHLPPDATDWEKVPGFVSVNSISGLPDDPYSVLVAESFKPLQREAAESSRGTRLAIVDARDYGTSAFEGPPFDTTSEVEIAGVDRDLGLVIRVSGKLYSRQERALGERIGEYLNSQRSQ